MRKFRDATPRLRTDDGATAVEYAIMVAGIAMVIILAVFFIGQELQSDFSCVEDSMQDPASAPAC